MLDVLRKIVLEVDNAASLQTALDVIVSSVL